MLLPFAALRASVRAACPHTRLALGIVCLLSPAALARAQQTAFQPGNLVVSVEGCGVYGGTCTVPNGTGDGTGNSALGGYGDNQAAPFTLFQFAPSGTTAATYVNSLVLPQAGSATQYPVSGEYGSSSEGTLQLSADGQFLVLLGYGVNAAAFDANPAQYGAAPSLALGQSGSLTGQSTTAVPRVLALVDSLGNTSTSTALFNVYNANNPRSANTANGTGVYTSGQGASGDTTGGIFFSPIGAANTRPTPIIGLDTTNNTATQDTRAVEVVGNTLYVSVDSKAGSNAARDFVGTLGTPGTLPTTTTGAPTMLNGYGNSGGTGKVSISGNGNGLNEGLQINVSPENFFFASPSVLYVADSGSPKNNSATSTLGDGGLQKWVNSAADGSGTWSLAYTLAKGLGLVANTAGHGVSGLYGLTGTVQGGQALLYATSYALSDLDVTSLYGIADTLSNMTAAGAAGESFSTLATAPKDSNFKGVAFAPTVTPNNNLQLAQSLKSTGSGYAVTLTVRNAGSTTAEDAVLTGVTVNGVAATGTPVVLGPLAAGASAVATVQVGSSAGAAGKAAVERVTGTLMGGSFGATLRTTLPQ